MPHLYKQERKRPEGAIKPDPHCSWKGRFRRVGAGFGDESAESGRIIPPFHILLAIHPERRMCVVVFR